MLLERISLHSICRALSVSLTWLLDFIAAPMSSCLMISMSKLVANTARVRLLRLEAEADETWSFVGNKANKQWIWMAVDIQTKQVIAFYVGDRSRDSAQQLWNRLPESYQESATFYTDE